MSNKTHTKPHSKKKEGEQYYFREYKHPGHNGTKIGHTDWKHRGGMYFSKNEKYLIARVLDGTIDPMPWVESWPLKPLDFEPLIWGEPREIEDDQKAIDPPSLDDIEALELQHMALEDTRNRLETALETLDIQEKNIVLRTPSRGEEQATTPGEGESQTDPEGGESSASPDDGMPPTTPSEDESKQGENPAPNVLRENRLRKIDSERQVIEHSILKCRLKLQKLEKLIEFDKSRFEEQKRAKAKAESRRWSDTDILFQDNTRMTPITIYANAVESASEELTLWMSTTASDVTKGSIKKMEVGYTKSPLKGFIVLERLNLKFGKDTTATGNVSTIGKAMSLNFQYGKETATDYLDRMLDLLEGVTGYDELLETVIKAIPTILIGRLHRPKYGAYCDLATKMLLNPLFTELSLGPYKDFRDTLHTTELTMKCFIKSKVDVESKRSSKKSAEKANAAKSNSKKKGDDKKRKSNDTKSHDHANAADGDDLQCYNCSNDKKLLKQYKASEHKTRDCPFIQSKAQRQYYQKGKIAPDLNRFKEFADGAHDSGTSADESDGD